MGILNFLAIAVEGLSAKAEPSLGVVVATGVVLVFGVLILLYLLITLEGVIFTAIDQKKKGTKAPEKAAAPEKAKAQAPVKTAVSKNAPVVEAGISGEIVAAIAAAVACMEDGGRYVIRSVKRAKTSGRNAWGQAAVNSYTEPF